MEKRLHRGETTLYEEGTIWRKITQKRYKTKGLSREKLHGEKTIQKKMSFEISFIQKKFTFKIIFEKQQ